MVNKLKLAIIHVTPQNPMQICACAWIYRWTKNYGKSGLGYRASGPPGVAGRGPRDIVYDCEWIFVGNFGEVNDEEGQREWVW